MASESFKVGDKVRIRCSRKGLYDAVVVKDFTTEDEWYEVALDQDSPVIGASTAWERGDKVPCRASHAHISRR